MNAGLSWSAALLSWMLSKRLSCLVQMRRRMRVSTDPRSSPALFSSSCSDLSHRQDHPYQRKALAYVDTLISPGRDSCSYSQVLLVCELPPS